MEPVVNNYIKLENTLAYKKLFINTPITTRHSLPTPLITAKADSGASKHYFRTRDQFALRAIKNLPNGGPIVHLPNNMTMQAERVGHLPFTQLSDQATKTHIFDDLKSSSLISLGQLCDDGCNILPNNTHMNVFKNDKLVIQGHRNVTDGLLDIPLS